MKQLLSLVFALVLGLPVAAAGQDLGRVSLDVPDRTREARAEGLREGLRNVLVRLTGERSPEDSPALEAILQGEPSRWVIQYSYEGEAGSGETSGVETGEDADTEGESTLRLTADFDVTGLSERLAEAGAPVWGRQRPAVLFWVVDQGAGRGEFVGRDDRGKTAERLREVAADRGLPLLLPELDSRDRRHVRPADVRGRFDEPVREASRRYEAPYVVTAVLYRGSNPRLRWRLLEQDSELSAGSFEQADSGALLAALVHGVTDHLAGLYAVRPGEGRSVLVRVRELSRLADWKLARDHLADMPGMQGLHIRQLNDTTAVFVGRFGGSREQLDRLARLQPGMKPCPTGLPGRDSAAEVRQAQTPENDADGGGPTDQPMTLEFCWFNEN